MQRRLTRITRWITFLRRRVGRKDEFTASQNILLSALGGNESAPTCNENTNTKYNGSYLTKCNYFLKLSFQAHLKLLEIVKTLCFLPVQYQICLEIKLKILYMIVVIQRFSSGGITKPVQGF